MISLEILIFSYRVEAGKQFLMFINTRMKGYKPEIEEYS